MFSRQRALWLPSMLVYLLAAAAAGVAAPPEDSAPARVKPLAVRKVGVLPWETVSESPFGGSRMGGSDRRGFVLSPDGKLLVGEDAGGWQLELWDVDSGKSLGRFGRIEDPVVLAFAPDGKTLASAGWVYSHCEVDLWDVTTRKHLRNLDEEVNGTPFTAAAFTPDGRTLALGAAPGRYTRGKTPAIHLWDTSSGDEVRLLEGLSAAAPRPGDDHFRHYEALAFAPDGRSLAVVTGPRVILVELGSGKERALLGVLPPVYGRWDWRRPRNMSAAFAPDGRTLAVGSVDGVIRLWDVGSGGEFRPFVGHEGTVRSLAFAPDGKTLFSFGADNQVLTWAVADARRLWPGRDGKPSRRELGDWWADLGGTDRAAALAALGALAASPAEAVPFLREVLRPVPATDSERVKRLVAELSNEDFNTRKRAAIELRTVGDLAIPALREEVQKRHDDVPRRMLERFEQQYPTPAQLQALRGVQVLERINNDDSRKLLDELAAGEPESELTRQARAAVERLGKTAASVPRGKLEALWADLGQDDARKAFAAVRALSGRPGEAVPFLLDRLRTVADREGFDDDPKRIAKLIADLDSDEFRVREGAEKALASLGKTAEAALRKALDASPSLEARRRIEALLRQAGSPLPSPERLQADRALEALERANTAEARAALERLAGPTRNAWLREASAAALRRLGK